MRGSCDVYNVKARYSLFSLRMPRVYTKMMLCGPTASARIAVYIEGACSLTQERDPSKSIPGLIDIAGYPAKID